MTKRYGVPYGMSKNRIARKLVEFLPPADTFVDLFAGGCAVAHAALESGKYRHVIINDINPMPTQFFADALAGKYDDERRVIDRETFNQLKDTDPYVKYCWSFSCAGFSYTWGKNVETVKLAACKLILAEPDEQQEALQEFQKLTDINTDDELLGSVLAEPNWSERRLKFIRYANRTKELEDVRWLGPLTRLDCVQRLKNIVNSESITMLTQDYKTVDIPTGSVVYCDIPYRGLNVVKNMGMEGFDYNEFCEWTRDKSNVFVSSYDLPTSYFECVRGWDKRTTMRRYIKDSKVLEKIFVPRIALHESNDKNRMSEQGRREVVFFINGGGDNENNNEDAAGIG